MKQIQKRKEYESDFLQAVINRYLIAGDIKKSSRFDLGFEDTNYLVVVDDKKYVLKIFETPDTPQGSILFKAEIMNETFGAGIKTPRVYRDKDTSLVTVHDEKQCLLMDYIEGANMAESQFSDSLVHEVGREAGKIDALLSSIKDRSRVNPSLSLDLANFLERETDIGYLPAEFDRRIFLEVIESFKRIKPEFDILPAGVIHYDIVAHNVIAENQKLSAIIDFSDVVFAPYAQNVAASLCQTVFWYNWKPHQAGIFLKGYREFKSFSVREAALLFDLVMARYVTLIVGLNNRTRQFGYNERRERYMHDRYHHLKRLADFGRERFNSSSTISESVAVPMPVTA